MTRARKLKLIAALKRMGYRRPYRTVQAIEWANISLATALTLLRKESGGGKNIFGCDHGPRSKAPWCNQHVTFERVQELRATGKYNGIGPCQLTHPAWVTRFPSTWLTVHKPLINMKAGFLGFRKMVEQPGTSLWEAARAYNGAASYADHFLKVRREVVRDLKAHGFTDKEINTGEGV